MAAPRFGRVLTLAAAVLVTELIVALALTGDRGHVLVHIVAAFVGLAAIWAAVRVSRPNRGFERWARRGFVGALCVAVVAQAFEGLGAVGYADDGFTERWPALAAWHDFVALYVSVPAILLLLAASAVTLMVLGLRAAAAARSR
jgi:hypothetical protein